MKQALEDLTQNLQFENGNSIIDIEEPVIKVGLKPALTENQKMSNGRHGNATQEEYIVEIKTENTELDQNQQTQNNEEKQSNSKENSPTLKERSTKKANIEKKNICEICKKSFSRKDYLKLHVKTVHDEVKGHKCDICGKPFCQNWELRIHAKTVHNSIKPHKCVSCNKRFGQKSNFEKHMKS